MHHIINQLISQHLNNVNFNQVYNNNSLNYFKKEHINLNIFYIFLVNNFQKFHNLKLLLIDITILNLNNILVHITHNEVN